MEDLSEIVGGLIIVSGLVSIVYFITKYNYLTRKAAIEHGNEPNQANQRLRYLEWGCIALSLGLGLLVSSLFTLMSLSEDTLDMMMWGTILIFGGFGLLVAHYIRNRFGNQ
ncbi:MAG: DUF6249 domain-containing protein [Bacteroidota bacterium]